MLFVWKLSCISKMLTRQVKILLNLTLNLIKEKKYKSYPHKYT